VLLIEVRLLLLVCSVIRQYGNTGVPYRVHSGFQCVSLPLSLARHFPSLFPSSLSPPFSPPQNARWHLCAWVTKRVCVCVCACVCVCVCVWVALLHWGANDSMQFCITIFHLQGAYSYGLRTVIYNDCAQTPSLPPPPPPFPPFPLSHYRDRNERHGATPNQQKSAGKNGKIIKAFTPDAAGKVQKK